MAGRPSFDDWAADALPTDGQFALDEAELEFVAGAPGDAPAPYYAELVKQVDGRRLVYRTFFHDVDQLGLHPKSRSRIDGLLRGRGNLFIDPRGGQPRCAALHAVVQPYPTDAAHRCLVLPRDFAATPRGDDPFAAQKRIITASV